VFLSGAFAPPPVAVAAEEIREGEIPVKKIAVRVSTTAGGLIALLLAGGAFINRH
jgi:hypothetical protein